MSDETIKGLGIAGAIIIGAYAVQRIIRDSQQPVAVLDTAMTKIVNNWNETKNTVEDLIEDNATEWAKRGTTEVVDIYKVANNLKEAVDTLTKDTSGQDAVKVIEEKVEDIRKTRDRIVQNIAEIEVIKLENLKSAVETSPLSAFNALLASERTEMG